MFFIQTAVCSNSDTAAKGRKRIKPVSSVAKAAQEVPPVQLVVTKLIPQPGQIMYRYNVVNGSAFPITAITIGYNYFLTKPELRFAPIGWDGSAVPPSSVQSPPGWVFSLIQTDDDSLVSIRWTAANQQEFIKGGKSLAGFSVLLTDADSLYELGHWTSYLSTSAQTPFSAALQPSGVTAVPPSSVEAHAGVLVGPNPARTSVSIQYEVPVKGTTIVEVFDAGGRRVRELLNEMRPAGTSSLRWDGKDTAGKTVGAGTYFLRIRTPATLRFARVVWLHE